MSDLINRKTVISVAESCTFSSSYDRTRYMDFLHYCLNTAPIVDAVPVVHGEWVYWKEQCEYCMNRNACSYPENQEAMEALKQWEKENKFWGSLKLICDYYFIDKDKYYLDNPLECNAKG